MGWSVWVGMTTETPAPNSYLTIPESHLDRLEDRLAQLNRRAAKLGLAEATVAEISRETRRTSVGRNKAGDEVYTSRVWLVLGVSGDKPTVPGGWALVGAIDHSDMIDGSLNILRAPRGETVPETYRKAPPTCDHCRATRRRRDTFILRAEDGSHQQIGRNCLQDFLGAGTTAAQIVGWLEFVREIEAVTGESEDAGESSSRGGYEDTGRYLAAVAASVRVDGWTSRGKAYDEGGASTADAAWRVLYPTPRDLEDRSHPRIAPDDIDAAEKALTWIRDLPETERADGYLANLFAACARDGFRTKQDGVIASLVGAAFPRAMGDIEAARRKAAEAEARTARGVSQHIGEPKGKIKGLDVTIEKIRGWEGHYGYTTLVTMRDANNNLLVWYASGDKADDLPAEGAACKLTGGIKAHGTDKYTGEACTTATRCKLT